MIGHFQFKFVSFYGQTELTWGLQTMSYDWSELLRSLRPRGLQITPFDWSELFKFVPLYGKADAICFQRPYHVLSKTTMKDA